MDNQGTFDESNPNIYYQQNITDLANFVKSKVVENYNNDYKTAQSNKEIQPKFQRIQNQNSGQLSLFDTAIQTNLFQQEQIFQPQSETGQNVQLEIGLSYDKQKIEEKKKEEISEIEKFDTNKNQIYKKQYKFKSFLSHIFGGFAR